jgi:hypothetical protein
MLLITVAHCRPRAPDIAGMVGLALLDSRTCPEARPWSPRTTICHRRNDYGKILPRSPARESASSVVEAATIMPSTENGVSAAT